MKLKCPVGVCFDAYVNVEGAAEEGREEKAESQKYYSIS